ncbi:adenylate kinase [Parafrankia sp. FMc2]|uniref:adenylate kinase n=1 Tax=Parafrankia sp. FMc2 TaxID=3233196 RepID=UPI0034D6D509
MHAKRILVVGSGGTGKSTPSRRLGVPWDIPVIHLDQHFWSPGWIEMPQESWRQTVNELISQPRWIMDGNYAGTLDLRIPAADVILFLDLPRHVALSRVMWRRIRWHHRHRPDITPGCSERISWEFLRWVWAYPRQGRARVSAALDEADAWARVVRLRSPREVRQWLARQLPP